MQPQFSYIIWLQKLFSYLSTATDSPHTQKSTTDQVLATRIQPMIYWTWNYNLIRKILCHWLNANLLLWSCWLAPSPIDCHTDQTMLQQCIWIHQILCCTFAKHKNIYNLLRNKSFTNFLDPPSASGGSQLLVRLSLCLPPIRCVTSCATTFGRTQ